MAGVLGDRLHDHVADLTGEFVELLVRQTAKVGRIVDLLEQHGTAKLPLLCGQGVTAGPVTKRPVTSIESASIAEYGSRAKNSSALRASERIAV